MSNIGRHKFNFDVIAVDFDGTLIRGGQYPYADVREVNCEMVSLVKYWMGCSNIKLVLWSCRDINSDPKAYANMIRFCKYYGLEFDAINDNIQEYKDVGVKCRKIIADIYVDDNSASLNNLKSINLNSDQRELVDGINMTIFGKHLVEDFITFGGKDVGV